MKNKALHTIIIGDSSHMGEVNNLTVFWEAKRHNSEKGGCKDEAMEIL